MRDARRRRHRHRRTLYSFCDLHLVWMELELQYSIFGLASQYMYAYYWKVGPELQICIVYTKERGRRKRDCIIITTGQNEYRKKINGNDNKHSMNEKS